MPWSLARKLSNLVSSVDAKSSQTPGVRFAFKLFLELTSSGDSNLFFSPASAMLCLLMIHDAAVGETRSEMAKALEVAGIGSDEVERTIAYLRTSCGARTDVEVSVANSLWCSNHARVLPEYAARVRDAYNAEISVQDLGAPDAVSRINAWANEKTKGRIPAIVSTVPALARLVALNAIYFNGRWWQPFDKKWTRDGLFTTAAGLKKQVPMMSQAGTFSYYEDRSLQAVVLPYKGGVNMYVILPVQVTDAKQFQPVLTADAWERRLARFAEGEGTVRLPRFKLDFDAQFDPALKALGMERVFDRNLAEFEGIRSEPPPIWIDQILHRAVVEVNERGTEAAAVTSLVMVGEAMSRRQPRRFEMIVDRPFFVAIRDQLSGVILFMGWVGDPSQQA